MAKKKTTSNQENRIIKYFRETKAELQKVVWPTRKEVTNLTVIVLAVTTGMSAALGIIDYLFSRLFVWIIN